VREEWSRARERVTPVKKRIVLSVEVRGRKVYRVTHWKKRGGKGEGDESEKVFSHKISN